MVVSPARACQPWPVTHWISAFVGPAQAMRRAASKLENAHCVDLGFRLCLVPLTEELGESLGAGDPLAPFEELSRSALDRWAALVDEPFGYLESRYWGGDGVQMAGAWRGTETLIEPVQAQDAVNVVLRLLGVKRAGSDEWDAVRLVRFRDEGDLLAAAVADRDREP